MAPSNYSGSDYNARVLIEQVVGHGCIPDSVYNKTNKSTLGVFFCRLVGSLKQDPIAMEAALERIAPKPTPTHIGPLPAVLGEYNDSSNSNSAPDGPSDGEAKEETVCNRSSQASSSSSTTGGSATDLKTSNGEGKPTASKGRVCVDLWWGNECSNPTKCQEEGRAHPKMCVAPNCPSYKACGQWHPKHKHKRMPSDKPAGNLQSDSRRQGNMGKGSNCRNSPPNKKPAPKSSAHEVLRLRALLAEAKERAAMVKLSYRDVVLNNNPTKVGPSGQDRNPTSFPPQRAPRMMENTSELANAIAQAVVAALASHRNLY